MEPIRVFCADCGKELYTTETLHEAPDGPRYCIEHFKTRQKDTFLQDNKALLDWLGQVQYARIDSIVDGFLESFRAHNRLLGLPAGNYEIVRLKHKFKNNAEHVVGSFVYNSVTGHKELLTRDGRVIEVKTYSDNLGVNWFGFYCSRKGCKGMVSFPAVEEVGKDLRVKGGWIEQFNGKGWVTCKELRGVVYC